MFDFIFQVSMVVGSGLFLFGAVAVCLFIVIKTIKLFLKEVS